MRLFFAIMLPQGVQDALAAFQGRLGWLPVRTSWTARENIHITLKFLGEVRQQDIEPLAREVRQNVAPLGTIHLRPEYVVVFPESRPARVLGIGFAGDVERMAQVAGEIEAVCVSMGFARENRAFKNHATLGRIKHGLHRRHSARIEASFVDWRDESDFEVSGFQLMQSRVGSEGSQYAVVARFE